MKKAYNVTIVRPENYIHSLAFLEAAETINYALLDMGIESRFSFNRLDKDRINIIFGAHLLSEEEISDVISHSIIFNAEQTESTHEQWRERIVYAAEQGAEFWDYSDYNIAYMKSLGFDKIRKFDFGYNEHMNRLRLRGRQSIDVLFYGSMKERRKLVLQKLTDKGLNVKAVFGVYAQERDLLIKKSKLVINMHNFDSQIFEIFRAFYLFNNGVALVSEVNPETQIEPKYLDCMYAAPYEDLVEVVCELAGSESRLADLRAQALENFSKIKQVDILRELIA